MTPPPDPNPTARPTVAPAPEPKQGSEEPLENARDCKHGRLKRKCDECDMEREIAALRAEVLDLKRKLEVLESDRGKGCNPSRDPDHNVR